MPAHDAVDQRRIRLARTTLASVAAAALWTALGVEWVEAWCAGACRGDDLAAFAVPVAWGAAASLVAGRAAWSWHRGTWVAGLALLAWSAWSVTYPAASAGILAGPVMRWSQALGFAGGFLLHGLLLGTLHVGGAYVVERWATPGRHAA